MGVTVLFIWYNLGDLGLVKDTLLRWSSFLVGRNQKVWQADHLVCWTVWKAGNVIAFRNDVAHIKTYFIFYFSSMVED